jgi:hypothetical protein
MKKLVILALGILPAHSAVLWMENFEDYDTGISNLEDQSEGAWLTDPEGTTSIAVISNSALPANFGGKSLAVGGLDPGTAATTLGVAYALSPEAAGFDPVASSPKTELNFSADFILNTGGTTTTLLLDDFRLSFADLNGRELSTLLFTQARDGAGNLIPGSATIIRSNGAPGGVYNTQALISLNAAFSLNLVMNPLLNKWSGSIGIPTGGSFSLFSNVDLTQNPGPPVPDATVGSFAIDWIKGGTSFGENYLTADNFLLQSQLPIPEPGAPLLISLSALGCILRRRR